MPEYVAQIRLASDTDAARLAIMAESTFRDTFQQANSVEDMDLYCAKSFGLARQLAEIQDPAMSTLLVEIGVELIAFGQLRFGATLECIQGHKPVEIYRLYVASSWHGRGIAQELMTALINHAFKGDADCLWLGVWEHNPRAIAFYRKFQFQIVGEHIFVLGNDRQRDLIMEYKGNAQ